MAKLQGVQSVTVGYANGKSDKTSYYEIATTDHAETVHVTYDPTKTNLTTLLAYYFKIIEPTSVDKQGNDVGRQYRTGIYYTDLQDEGIIRAFMEKEQKKLDKKIVVEVEPLKNYVLAEEEHQDYLAKNPNGYCHIDLNLADGKIHLEDPAVEKQKIPELKFEKKSPEVLKKELTPMQFAVTQNNETEVPFQNEYFNEFKKGIYVDVTTGEPLFSSADKFDSGCGWPGFSKPIEKETIKYLEDATLGMKRTEVRSQLGDAHLGHVFDDGPRELGGKRYCINSASLRFIPYEKMKEEGYEKYMKLVEKEGK